MTTTTAPFHNELHITCIAYI